MVDHPADIDPSEFAPPAWPLFWEQIEVGPNRTLWTGWLKRWAFDDFVQSCGFHADENGPVFDGPMPGYGICLAPMVPFVGDHGKITKVANVTFVPEISDHWDGTKWEWVRRAALNVYGAAA